MASQDSWNIFALGRLPVFMLESFPSAFLVATVLGFLSGLGVGGGSLLILWLNLVLGMQQTEARNINLLFFLPAAAVSCCFRWKQGTLDWKKVLPAVISGCIAAMVGFHLSTMTEPNILKKFFGWLLLITAIRELSYWKQNR